MKLLSADPHYQCLTDEIPMEKKFEVLEEIMNKLEEIERNWFTVLLSIDHIDELRKRIWGFWIVLA